MAKPKKTLDAVLSGRSDQNIRFDDLRKLLKALAFDERIKGGHCIFTRPRIVEIINLQPRKDATAKPYQVKQCRDIITHYGLGIDS